MLLTAADQIAAHTFAAAVGTDQPRAHIASAHPAALDVAVIAISSRRSACVALPHQLIECGLVLGVSRIHLDCPGVIAVRLVQPSMYIKHSAAQIVPLGIPALLRNPLQQLLRFAQAVGIEQLPNIGKLRPTLTRVALTGVARIGLSTVC